MRRIAALVAVLGSAALGCHHIGGKCDCQAHPSDAVMPAPSTPYPATSLTGGPAAPAVVAPVAPARVPDKMLVAPVAPLVK